MIKTSHSLGIVADELGEAIVIFRDINGKILKVITEYSEHSSDLCEIKIETDDGDIVLDISKTETIIHKPRDLITLGETIGGLTQVDYFYNTGVIRAYITDTGVRNQLILRDLAIVYEDGEQSWK